MTPTKAILVLAALCASFGAACKVDIDPSGSLAGRSSAVAPSAAPVKPELDVPRYLYVAATAGSRMTGLVFKQSTNAAAPDRARTDVTANPDSQSVALLLAILGAVAFIGRRRRRD